MNTGLKIRVILDTDKSDIFRDIVVTPSENLSHLADVIVAAFEVAPGEMSSFYLSDDEWNQGDEIPMMDMGFSKEPTLDMQKVLIENSLGRPHQRMLFVYDFIKMWTFFVETIEETAIAEGMETPYISLAVGDNPEDAPEKNFEGDGKKIGMFDDAFDDDDFDDDDFEEEGSEFDHF